MKVTLEFEVSNYEELFDQLTVWLAGYAGPPPEPPPVEPPPVEPPPPQPPPPGALDAWQTTVPGEWNYWPPIFGTPPDMSPSAYFAAGYQVPFRPSDPPVTPPAPPEPPPSAGDGLPADLVLGWKYRTIAWCREHGVGSFYRWEEPMCALQQLCYDIKVSGKPMDEVLDFFEIDGYLLRHYYPADNEPLETFLRRAWEEAYHGDTAMMGPIPLWQYMMENKELGFSPAVWDDYGRGSKRAYSAYWGGNSYIGPLDTNYGMIELDNPWHAAIRAKWGIQ
jgi:hypothetical protein